MSHSTDDRFSAALIAGSRSTLPVPTGTLTNGSSAYAELGRFTPSLTWSETTRSPSLSITEAGSAPPTTTQNVSTWKSTASPKPAASRSMTGMPSTSAISLSWL